MSTIALVLIAVSVVAHVAWNFLGKRGQPSAGFFLLANTLGALCLVPLPWLHFDLLSDVPLEVWFIIPVTGIFQALYFVGLAGAYRSGDLSVAYPVARSFPAVLVAISSVVFGTADRLTLQCLVGIGFVILGGFLIPLRRFRSLSLRNYLNPCCALALLAALGTAGYSRLDSQAIGLLSGLPQQPLGLMTAALIYAPLEGISASFFLAAFVLIKKRERLSWFSATKTNTKSAAIAGIMMYFSYTLVLMAMAFVSEVSYLVAFRQLSVPLTAVVGVVLLREPAHSPKFLGIGLSFLGLVLVATG